MTHFSGTRRFWLFVSVSVILGTFLLRGQEYLRYRLGEIKKAYELDLELSRHQAEHLKAYQEILRSGTPPEGKPLLPNDWIQLTQKMVAEAKLSLQELKPSRERERNRSRGVDLSLVVEGRMTELVDLLYRIATAKDLVYIKKVSISQVDEGSDLIRAQMTLSQV